MENDSHWYKQIKLATWYTNQLNDPICYMPKVSDISTEEKTVKDIQQDFGIDGKKVLPKNSKMLREIKKRK